jgi:transposase
METLTALRCNHSIKQFYQSLENKGKRAKVVIVACMHKLLEILNGRLYGHLNGLAVY